jgi:5-methyltetrahydropteroyltriglutamate--homocysteine methyltransferase
MFPTTIVGSLPKPNWLVEPAQLWAPWKLSGEELARGQRDAALVMLKLQEDAGLDIVTDGEVFRQHFVHGILEHIDGLDFKNKKRIGIRADRYEADCPRVIGPIARRKPIHAVEAAYTRAHTKQKLKFTMPGPMTIVDTLADEYYRDRPKLAMEFAKILNQEARELEAAGVDVIQFDEPAYNVYMDEVASWGIDTLERAAEGLKCQTAVHICYGYGIKANIDWKGTLGSEWRQYEKTFPVLARSKIDQVSLECAGSRVPPHVLSMLKGKDVMVGVIDVATVRIETPQEVAQTIRDAMKHVEPEHIIPSTNCGMVPLSREVAVGKMEALAKGAAIVRKEVGKG